MKKFLLSIFVFMLMACASIGGGILLSACDYSTEQTGRGFDNSENEENNESADSEDSENGDLIAQAINVGDNWYGRAYNTSSTGTETNTGLSIMLQAWNGSYNSSYGTWSFSKQGSATTINGYRRFSFSSGGYVEVIPSGHKTSTLTAGYRFMGLSTSSVGLHEATTDPVGRNRYVYNNSFNYSSPPTRGMTFSNTSLNIYAIFRYCYYIQLRSNGQDTIYYIPRTYTFSLPNPTNTPSNYTFKGWYTGANGSGTKYTRIKPTSNRTLYAYFTPNTAQLDVNMNIAGTLYGTGPSGYTFNVYQNNSKIASNVRDYCQNVNIGASIKIEVMNVPVGYKFSKITHPGGTSTSTTATFTMPSGSSSVVIYYTVNRYYININIYDPGGAEQYGGSAGKFSIVDENGANKDNVTNEGEHSKLNYGNSFIIYNVNPASGMRLTSVTLDGPGKLEKTTYNSYEAWKYTATGYSSDTPVNGDDYAATVKIKMSWKQYRVNINILNPSGTEDNKSGTCKLVFSSPAQTIENTNNEPASPLINHGGTIKISNIKPATGYKLGSVSLKTSGKGTLKDNGDGSYTFTASNDGTHNSGWYNEIIIKMAWDPHKVDVNTYVDGVSYTGGKTGFTFDVYLNGTRTDNDISDYYSDINYGSTWKITDIKCPAGYSFARIDYLEQSSSSGEFQFSMPNYNVNVAIHFSSNSYNVYFDTDEKYVTLPYNIGRYNATISTETSIVGNTRVVRANINEVGGGHAGFYFTGPTATVTGKKYKWTVDIRASRDISFAYLGNEKGGHISTSVTTTWKTITHTFTASNSQNVAAFLFYAYYKVGDWVEVRNCMVLPASLVTSDYAQAPRTVLYNGTYGDLPTPTSRGHKFEGWYLNSDYSGEKVTSSTVVSTASDHILYAKWSSEVYKVTYDSNGGTQVEDDYVAVGDTYGKINIYNPTPSSTDGMELSSDIYSVNYTNTSTNTVKYFNFVQRFTGIYAPNTTYTVVLEVLSYSGTRLIMKITSPYDVSSTNSDVATGQTLIQAYNTGVYTKTFTTLSNIGSPPYNLRSFVYVDPGHTINATFRISIFLGNVYFDSFNYASVGNMPSTNTLPSPTKTGYTFAGWYSSNNFNTEQITASTVVETKSNHTLYAKWSANEYTVSFVDYDGDQVSTKKVKFESPYGVLPDLNGTRPGYAFDGWYLDNGTFQQKIEISTIVSIPNDHTLYAKWTPKNVAKYDEEKGLWYVEIGEMPQTRETDEEVISALQTASENGNSFVIAGDTLYCYTYGANEYALYNGEFYKVEPVRYYLQGTYSSGDATESASVVAVSSKIVFAGVYSSEYLGVNSGFSNSDLNNSAQSYFSRSEFEIYLDAGIINRAEYEYDKYSPMGTTIETVSNLLGTVSSKEEIASVHGYIDEDIDAEAEFTDLVKAIIGKQSKYWLRGLGTNLDSAESVNKFGSILETNASTLLGARLTINIKTYVCE